MDRIEKLRVAFTKSYNYEAKNLYILTHDMSSQELEIIFQNEKAFKRMLKAIVKNKNTLLDFFRILPASIQEKMWDIDEIRHLLMGITDLAWQVKNRYFPSYMIDRIRVLTKAIKSEAINQSLADDVCFQTVILFGKDIDPCILKHIDIERLMLKTSENIYYDRASINRKEDWIIFLNTLVEKICLPRYYQGCTCLDFFERLIEFKRNYLRNQGKVISIDEKILDKINDNECAIIYNIICDDLGSIEERNLIQAKINEKITKAIQEGKIFTLDFLNLVNIGTDYEYYIFKAINEKIKENKELEEQYLKFIRDYLFGEQVDEEFKEQINVYIKNDLFNRSKEELAKLCCKSSYIKSLFHMRFGVTSNHMDYIEKFDKSLIMKLNVKNINKIVKLLLGYIQTDEISDIYAKAIRMYLVFGLDRTISILSGIYGKIYKHFFDNLSKVNVDNVPFEMIGKKYEPKPNKEFLDFIFAGNNIYKFLEKDSVILSKWSYLYNNLERIRLICRGHLTMRQVEDILQNMKIDYPVSPDLYRIKDVLPEVSLGNRSGHLDMEVYEEAVKVYKQQLERKESSIPYVMGYTKNGYKYEVMRLDDPIIYTLGYKEKCCFRVLDIGHNHLLYAALCKNGRILLTYTPEGKLASFSPLKRNGEILIANSIEVNIEDANEEVLEAFMEGINAIMLATKKKEECYLKVACIGDNVANLHPNGFGWPKNIETPTILEKDDKLYSETDNYHKKLKVIKVLDETKLDNLKYGEVQINYEDPRPEIKALDLQEDDVKKMTELVNVIKAVNYKKDERADNVNLRYIKYAFFSKDWYILVDYNLKLYSENIMGNEDALKEMRYTLELLAEKIKTQSIDEYILKLQKKGDF